MSGYDDLLSDPIAALGYGLLTSRQNPLGSAFDVLQKGSQQKRQREQEDLKNRMLREEMDINRQKLNKEQYEKVGNVLGRITPEGGFQKIYEAPFAPKSQGNSKVSENEKQALALQTAFGLTPQEAYLQANGFIDIGTPDNLGRIPIVNKVTGDLRYAGQPANNAPPDNGGMSLIPPPAQPAAQAFEDLTEVGTGASGQIAGATNTLIGTVGDLFGNPDMIPFPERENAATRLRNFNKFMESSLVNNPKFPVAELKQVQSLLPNPDSFFTSGGKEKIKAEQLRGFLQNRISLNNQSLAAGTITTDRRGTITDMNDIMQQALSMMGNAPVGQQNAHQQPQNIPPAEQRTKGRVYNTPKGPMQWTGTGWLPSGGQ